MLASIAAVDSRLALNLECAASTLSCCKQGLSGTLVFMSLVDSCNISAVCVLMTGFTARHRHVMACHMEHVPLQVQGCCEPVVLGNRRAATAEQMVRARFSAYAKQKPQYIIRTTHPDNPECKKVDKQNRGFAVRNSSTLVA